MPLQLLSSALENIPKDQKRLLLTILISFPVGFLNHFISGKTSRLIYGLIFGILFQLYMYQYAAIHVFICATITLLIIKLCDRNKIGWITAGYTFTHLSVLHIYRMIFDYGGWSMDITTIMMMTLCKFNSFAFCYSDGGKYETLTIHPKKNAIKEFSILEFYSFIYFYPTCIMGPFFEFSDYMDYINKTRDYEELPIYSAFLNGIRKLSLALVISCIYLLLKPHIGIEIYNKNSGNIYYPNSLIFMGFQCLRLRYIIGFLFSESVCSVSGISYRTGKFHKHLQADQSDFKKVISIDLTQTETTPRLSKFFQNWNISVHHWLKKYIYFRIYQNQQDYNNLYNKICAKVITFMISGFWHGFYPSYYIIFAHFSAILVLEENFYYIVKNMTSNSKFIIYFFEIIQWPFFLIEECYLLGILDSLHFVNMFRFMATVYFLPTIFIIVALAMTNRIIKNFKKKKRKKEDEIKTICN